MLRMSRFAAPCSHPHPSRWGTPARIDFSLGLQRRNNTIINVAHDHLSYFYRNRKTRNPITMPASPKNKLRPFTEISPATDRTSNPYVRTPAAMFNL